MPLPSDPPKKDPEFIERFPKLAAATVAKPCTVAAYGWIQKVLDQDGAER